MQANYATCKTVRWVRNYGCDGDIKVRPESVPTEGFWFEHPT